MNSAGGSATWEKSIEFYPWNPDSRSGLTKSTFMGLYDRKDRDYATLMKFATANPALKKYLEDRSQSSDARLADKASYKQLLSDLPAYNAVRKVQEYAEITAAVFSVVETGAAFYLRRPSGFGDLTVHEVQAIQAVVDKAGRPLEVGGSAAMGTRRSVGTKFPIGKGPGTRSDIDYIVPPSSIPNFKDLQHNLPDLDPKTGLIPGTGNPFIGPLIRFEPGLKKPIFIPAKIE